MQTRSEARPFRIVGARKNEPLPTRRFTMRRLMRVERAPATRAARPT